MFTLNLGKKTVTESHCHLPTDEILVLEKKKNVLKATGDLAVPCSWC